MSTTYTTGQVAKILKVHKNTILYWLKTGKAKEPKRDSLFNGRIWTKEEIKKLKILKTRKGGRRKRELLSQ